MTKQKVLVGSVLVLVLLFVFSIGILGCFSFSIDKEVPNRNQIMLENIFSGLDSDEQQDFGCSGSCYCSGKEDYRRISSVASFRTLFFSITAFSLGMALLHANNELQTECVNLFSESCEGSITSFVEFCEDHEENEDQDQVSSDVKLPEKYKDYEAEFECSGYCLKNGKFLAERSRPEARDLVEKYDCESLSTKGIVRVKIPRTGGKYLRKWNNELKKYEYSSEFGYPMLNQHARGQFLREYLSSFCKTNSKQFYSYLYKYPNGKPEYKKNTTNMCVGTNKTIDGLRISYSYANIKCKKTQDIW